MIKNNRRSSLLPTGLCLILFTVSPGSSACPDLTGTYLCPGNNPHAPRVLYTYQQSLGTDGQIYSVFGKIQGQGDYCSYQFTANGLQQAVTDSVTGRKLIVNATCSATLLNVSGTVQVDANTTLPFSEVLSLSDQGNLMDQSLNSAGQAVIEVCPRQ